MYAPLLKQASCHVKYLEVDCFGRPNQKNCLRLLLFSVGFCCLCIARLG